MNTSNTHWTFQFEVLSRALKDLESVYKAKPGSPEFLFLRAEAPSIFAEAREALSALRARVDELEHVDAPSVTPPTAH